MPIVRRMIVALAVTIGLLWDTPAAALATSTNYVRAEQTNSGQGGAETFILILAVLLVIAIGITMNMRRARKRREDEHWERLELKRAQYEQRLMALLPWASEYPQAWRYFDRAQHLLQGMGESLKLDNLNNAAGSLEDIERNVDKAWVQIVEATGFGIEAFYVERPNGNIATISSISHDPQPTDSIGHSYYFRGGVFGFMDWPAGYYPEPFWEWRYVGPFLDTRHDESRQDTFNTEITDEDRT